MRDNGFICTPTTTGKISLVSYQRKSDDWNRIGGNFYFHQDGSHLPSQPEFVALLCKNKGTTRTVTSITDGRKIYQHSAKIVGKKFLHSLMAVYIDSHKKMYTRPLVEKDEYGKCYLNTFHYIEPNLELLHEDDRKIFNLKLAKFILCFEKLQKQYTVYSHTWNNNDLIIFKNRAFHHARFNATNTTDKQRFLYRMWFTKK
jgi:alpha-ketoglutarate-dependent taurine dioxygenase